jgi:zona occludens toxin
MPIGVKTGLMGSGKSYEAVSEAIIPAIGSGRRVVTNIEGMDVDGCRRFAAEKYSKPLEAMGEIVCVTNDRITEPDFFPVPVEGSDPITYKPGTVGQPGDLYVFDEVWMFWSRSHKLSEEHMRFFRMHRHYVGGATGQCCDIDLMIQSIAGLHKDIRDVVAVSFRCKKHTAFGGLGARSYTVTMWEGGTQNQRDAQRAMLRRYDKRIFRLYGSYAGSTAGKELAVDRRQNILLSWQVWAFGLVLLGLLVAVPLMTKRTYDGFQEQAKLAGGTPGGESKVRAVDLSVTGRPQASPFVGPTGRPLQAAAATKAVLPEFSAKWRLVGFMQTGSRKWVIIADQAGKQRMEDETSFSWDAGRPVVGTVDGARVTSFSGGTPGRT